jgi:hypothetical protein
MMLPHIAALMQATGSLPRDVYFSAKPGLSGLEPGESCGCILFHIPNYGGNTLKKIFSLLAVAAFVLSITPSDGFAAQKKGAAVTNASVGSKQPRKFHYGTRMRARGGAGCKMSGSC